MILDQFEVRKNETAIQAIKSDQDVMAFAVLPSVDSRLQYLKTNGVKIGLTPAEVDFYMDIFVKEGVWTMDQTQVYCNFDAMNIGEISVSDYLQATMNLVSRITISSTYAYDVATLATTKQLANEFIQSINKSFKTLYEKSETSDKSMLFSWAHVGVQIHENNNKIKKNLTKQVPHD